MIVGQRKPLRELMDLIGKADRLLIVGCGTCVAVCLAGGEKEVGVLAAQLRLAYGLEGRKIEIEETTLERQCDREFLALLQRRIGDFDIVISMACGAGVQFLAETYSSKSVLPAVDTVFIGVAQEAGLWTERCRACGRCLLGLTAGICPVTMCAKGLMNGPCGGMMEGRCEVDPDQPCAWVTIHDRLKIAGQIESLNTSRPAVDYSKTKHPARLVHPAYKRRFSVGHEDV